MESSYLDGATFGAVVRHIVSMWGVRNRGREACLFGDKLGAHMLADTLQAGLNTGFYLFFLEPNTSHINYIRPLAFHATWNLTFNISPLSNITFHVARFLRDSLYASNIRYNRLHLFSGSYGHADRPDPA